MLLQGLGNGVQAKQQVVYAIRDTFKKWVVNREVAMVHVNKSYFEISRFSR